MASFGLEIFYLRCLQGLPALTLSTLVIIDAALLPAFLNFDLHLVFLGLYYWLIYRPDLISPLSIFLIGLFRGSLAGGPLGFSSVILLFAYGAAVRQRRYLLGKPFIMVWGGFVSLIVLTQGLEWASSMFLVHSFIDPQPLIFQVALTILSYPFLTQLLFKVQNWVPRKR